MIRNDGNQKGEFAQSEKLARRARLFFIVACLCMASMVAVAGMQILLLLLRDGRHAGLMDGGFAFIVTQKDFSEIPANFIPISRLAVWKSTLAAGLLTLRLIPGLIVLSSLVGLFRLYARRLIFTVKNEALLRRVAWALIAYALVPLVTHAALYLAKMSPVAVKLELRQLDATVLGIVLFAFANVVALGREIDRDRAGFV